jgi:hypothetical protein
MKTWFSRPKEEAYLFNPAFCCNTLSAAIQNYTSVRNEGIPFSLAFMFLPIVLHKPTRESLPPNTRTSMAAWLLENAEARVLFYERLVSLKPHTREAIQFGMLHAWIVLRNGGLLETTLSNAEVTRTTRALSDEARECVMRARFVGKWFAEAGETHTAMAFWGVRP